MNSLPTLAKRCRELNTQHEIELIILNPDSDTACNLYAAYRNKVRSGKSTGIQWDCVAVQNQLFATILFCAKYSIQEPLLRINLYLRNWFTSIRFDFSQSALIITREDNREPAIEILKDTVFYRGFKQEIRELQSQCANVDLSLVNTNEWDDSQIEEMLTNLGFKLTDPSQAEEIRKILSEASDPYA